MPLPPLGGLGKLNFRPTSGNNLGAPQGLTSINQAKSGLVSAAGLGKKNITSASQLTGTSHIYTAGDKTGMYKPGEAFGSKSTVSINQVINQKRNSATSVGDLPGKTAPSRPILPPL